MGWKSKLELWPYAASGISDSREGRPALGQYCSSVANHRLDLSRLRRWQTELNHSSPLQRRDPLHALQELGGYVKLNYFRHGSILQVSCPSTTYKTAPTSMSLPFPFALTDGISQPEFSRITSSTVCWSLSSHSKLDSLIAVSDAAGCHLIVKRMFCERPARIGQLPFREVAPTSTSSLHNHCVNRIKTVSKSPHSTIVPSPDLRSHRRKSRSIAALTPFQWFRHWIESVPSLPSEIVVLNEC